MLIRIAQIIFYLAITTLISSCGGGGGGASVAEGGIGGTGISTGTITGFGSVYVNGVKFNTAGAKIIEEDDTGSAITLTTDTAAEIEVYLNQGMVVTVKGIINDDGITGTAETISYEDILEGPVVGTPGGAATSFIAFGQTIHVSGTTVYSDGLTSIGDILDGQVVEVSGFVDETGDIHALYVEKKADTYLPSDEFEIKGTASFISTYVLNIGNLTISTSGIGLDVTSFNNRFIEAKGVFDSGTNTLTITNVEDIDFEDESFDIEDADKAELEGIAKTGCVATACDFTLGGIIVRVDTNTTYSGAGSSAVDINAGDKLEAEGSLQGGILIANKVELK